MPRYTLVPPHDSQVWVSTSKEVAGRVLCHKKNPFVVEDDKALLHIAKLNPNLMIVELEMTCRAMIANGIKLAASAAKSPVPAADEPDAVEIATTEKFVCDECGRDFASQHGLATHKRAKHAPPEPAEEDAPVEEGEGGES